MRDFHGYVLSEGNTVMFLDRQGRLSRGTIQRIHRDHEGIAVAFVVDAQGQTHQKPSHHLEVVEGTLCQNP